MARWDEAPPVLYTSVYEQAGSDYRCFIVDVKVDEKRVHLYIRVRGDGSLGGLQDALDSRLYQEAPLEDDQKASKGDDEADGEGGNGEGERTKGRRRRRRRNGGEAANRYLPLREESIVSISTDSFFAGRLTYERIPESTDGTFVFGDSGYSEVKIPFRQESVPAIKKNSFVVTFLNGDSHTFDAANIRDLRMKVAQHMKHDVWDVLLIDSKDCSTVIDDELEWEPPSIIRAVYSDEPKRLLSQSQWERILRAYAAQGNVTAIKRAVVAVDEIVRLQKEGEDQDWAWCGTREILRFERVARPSSAIGDHHGEAIVWWCLVHMILEEFPTYGMGEKLITELLRVSKQEISHAEDFQHTHVQQRILWDSIPEYAAKRLEGLTAA